MLFAPADFGSIQQDGKWKCDTLVLPLSPFAFMCRDVNQLTFTLLHVRVLKVSGVTTTRITAS